MAREVKIKVKQIDGSLGFTKVDLPENYQTEFNQNLDRSQKNGETIIRETREYELITPLFGGGAENKKADEVSVIRATEIRGHLRFWWRATRGGQFATIKELKEHEDAIFGSTESHSALQIEVVLEGDYEKRKEENLKNLESAFTVNKKMKWNPDTRKEEEKPEVINSPNIAPYATFPLLPDQYQRKDFKWESEKVKVATKFKVAISYPSEFKIIKVVDKKPKFEKPFPAKDEIQSAFWAWENFGGIGARTRRGFGALKICKHEINNELQSIEQVESEEKLRSKASVYIVGGNAPKGIPYLKNDLNLKVINKNKNAIETWKDLVEAYKNFRQQRKAMDTRFPKRSKWNEPEAIRELTKDRQAVHSKIDSLIFDEPKFPRADFGLPIITQFHFKNKSDPKKTNLKLVFSQDSIDG